MSLMTPVLWKGNVPESRLRAVLAVCVVTLGVLSIALLWQAQIIASQQQNIRWLEKLKFGG
ncbi:MAG TPA: hypothetical protein VGI16_04780 [Candidatus Acidoferrum sp.]|jgi:hypothetical protein